MTQIENAPEAPDEEVIAFDVLEADIGSFPGRADFRGLGELAGDELAPLLHARVPVTEAQYTLAERAWQAFRSV